MALVADRARAIYDKKAKERMLAGKKQDPVANSPQGSSGKSRDELGKAFGISGNTVDKPLARRKEIYLKLYPETKKGGVNQHTKDKLLSDKMSFSEDTARKTGKSTRTVKRDVGVGEKLADHPAGDTSTNHWHTDTMTACSPPT